MYGKWRVFLSPKFLPFVTPKKRLLKQEDSGSILVAFYSPTEDLQKTDCNSVSSLSDSLTTFAAQGIGFVENGGNAFLFCEGREWNA